MNENIKKNLNNLKTNGQNIKKIKKFQSKINFLNLEFLFLAFLEKSKF